MKIKKIPAVCLWIFVVSSIFQISLFAETWNIDAAGNWNTPANWSPATVPNGADETATFGSIITAPRTITVDAALGVTTLNIDNNNAYTIASGTLTIFQIFGTAPGIINITNINGNGAHAISSNLLLASGVFITQNSTNPVTFSGVISSSLSDTVLISGTGTLVLSGANTFEGLVLSDIDTLSISADNNLGNASNFLTLSNSTLNTTATFSTDRSVSLVGTAEFDTNVGTTFTVSATGALFGTGGLTKSGTGTLLLSGVNTYTGASSITSGVLELSGSGTLGNTSSLAISGGGSFVITAGAGSKTIGSLSGGGSGINLNDNGLVISQSAGNSFSGVISGTGGITKSGAATLTFSGVNTYTGGTTLSAGTLAVGADNNLGGTGALTFNGGTLNTTATFSSARDVTLSGAGTINTDGATTFTESGVISSTGGLTKSGTGILVLSGVNTYTGGTTVSAGTLAVGADNNLGGTGALTFNGGTLNTTATFSSARDVTLSGAGTINTDGATTFTESGVISSTGGLTKSGTGILVLSGTNTYTGGTTVSTGTLQGTTTSLQGNITNNATVAFSQATTGTYSDIISGTGAVTKADTGTVIVTGANTYSGGTTVSAGTLQGTTTSLQGDITNNATVAFNQSTTGAYGDVISGTGEVTKAGTGAVTLSGTNTYTGGTTVSAGTLLVSGTIVGTTEVQAGGTLGGTGTTGPVNNFGTVSPGASIGTTTIVGDYVQDASATLFVEIEPTGTSDLLDVSGTATLAGTFQLEPLAGTYIEGTSYTVVTAGSVVGTFDTLLETHPLDFTLLYSGTTVSLLINTSGTVLPVPISQLKGNAKKVAEYFLCDGFVSTNQDLIDVTTVLTALPADEFAEELTQLSPAQFGALPLTNLQNDTSMAATFAEKTEKLLRCPRNEDLVVWLEPLGYYYRQGGVQQQIPFNARTYGTALGVTKLFSNGWNVTAGAGYTHSSIKWRENAGKGDWNTFYLCPSIGWAKNEFYANLLALASFNYYDIDRQILFSTIRRTAHNDHRSYDILARFDGGKRFAVGSCFVQPEVRLSYLNIFEKAYAESGAGSISLDVSKKYSAFLRPEALVKGVKEWNIGITCISPSIYVGWLRNIALRDGKYTAKFVNQEVCESNFTVKSFDRSTNQLVLGSELVLSRANSLFILEYEANIGNSYNVQEGKARFEWRF